MIFKEPDGATPLEPEEIEGLKFPHIETRNQLNELEQANIQSGLLWLRRGRLGNILTEKFIKKLHIRLFGDVWQWAGTYRTTGKNIGIEAYQIPTELNQLLDDVQYWHENKTYVPLEAGARFHHRLVQIHPFPNGNGRHARIMTDIVLNKIYDHPSINWASDEDLMDIGPRRREYINALREADRHNYEPLFIFVGLTE